MEFPALVIWLLLAGVGVILLPFAITTRAEASIGGFVTPEVGGPSS